MGPMGRISLIRDRQMAGRLPALRLYDNLTKSRRNCSQMKNIPRQE